MNRNKVFIFSNDSEASKRTEAMVRDRIDRLDDTFCTETLSEDTDLIVCIGGDGTLLRFLQAYDYPKQPIVGINTGHLGFFQEVLPQSLDQFITQYREGNFTVQPYNTVKAFVDTKDSTVTHIGLNEVVIKGIPNYPVHLNISINDSFIERFCGDGLCLSTPAGSTAYNYSLGGSIVDPRLKLLQVAPMAPINSVAYRSFTSSILLPADDTLTVTPCDKGHSSLKVVADGTSAEYDDIGEIRVRLSKREVRLVRFQYSNFWEKVKNKFL